MWSYVYPAISSEMLDWVAEGDLTRHQVGIMQASQLACSSPSISDLLSFQSQHRLLSMIHQTPYPIRDVLRLLVPAVPPISETCKKRERVSTFLCLLSKVPSLPIKIAVQYKVAPSFSIIPIERLVLFSLAAF